MDEQVAGKKRKHLSEKRQRLSKEGSFENETNGDEESRRKKSKKYAKIREELEAILNNEFVEDLTVVDKKVKKKLKENVKRCGDRELNEASSNEGESCERKQKKAKVDSSMILNKKNRNASLSQTSEDFILHKTKHQHKSNTSEHSTSYNPDFRKSPMNSPLLSNDSSVASDHVEKKKTNKNRSYSLPLTPDDFLVQRTKHKRKSDTREHSTSDSPDFIKSSINSPLFSSVEKERKHKRKKKEKEREQNGGHHECVVNEATSNTEESCEGFALNKGKHKRKSDTRDHSTLDSPNFRKSSINSPLFSSVEKEKKHKRKKKEEEREQNGGHHECVVNDTTSNTEESCEGFALNKGKHKRKLDTRDHSTSDGPYFRKSAIKRSLSSSAGKEKRHKREKKEKERDQNRTHQECELNNANSNTEKVYKEFVLKKTSHKHKSETRELSTSHSPDVNSSLLSSVENKRRHKQKKKKDKERERSGGHQECELNGASSNTENSGKQKKANGDSSIVANTIKEKRSQNSFLSPERSQKKKKKKEKTWRRMRASGTEAADNANRRHSDGKIEAIEQANEIHETWRISQERLKELEEKGIKVRKGKWSLKELDLLKSNMATFLENHGLSGPSEILFRSTMDKNDYDFWKHFARESEFYKHLGYGIRRSLETIYKCARRIYDDLNYIGRYADEEIKELRRLYSIHGKDWLTIGQQMGRSRMSVNRKWSILPTTEGGYHRGNWTHDEVNLLKEAVHLVTNIPEDQPVPFKGICWQAVADIVKTRHSDQCRLKWLHCLCFKEGKSTSEKPWTADDDCKLITRLYRSRVTADCEVDWMDVKSEFQTNYSPQWLRHKWLLIKQRVPNYQQLDFEDIVDFLYHEYVEDLPNVNNSV